MCYSELHILGTAEKGLLSSQNTKPPKFESSSSSQLWLWAKVSFWVPTQAGLSFFEQYFLCSVESPCGQLCIRTLPLV